MTDILGDSVRQKEPHDADGSDGSGDVTRVRDPSRERVRCGKTPIFGVVIVVVVVVERVVVVIARSGETGDFCASR